MKYFKYTPQIIIFVSILTTNAYSATMQPRGIVNCEDARLSNKKARNWETDHQDQPANEKNYSLFINKSPWCSIVPAKDGKAQHKSIMHYDRFGIASEIQIHKIGELSWIMKNWRTIRKICVVPRALKKAVLKYRRPAYSYKKCNIDLMTTRWGAFRIHQWGKSEKGHKNKSRRTFFPNFIGKRRP